MQISAITVDVQPDTRYKNFKQIYRSSEIKIPLVTMHDT